MDDRSSSAPRKRAYHSPMRQRQMEETRRNMLAAARQLFVQHGYAGTTIEAVAEGAGVSPKTVLAAFGSKRGILIELLGTDALGEPYKELLAQLLATQDPYQRVRLVAQMTRQNCEALTPEFDLLRGAVAVAPELAEISRTVEERRWGLQERFITFLEGCGVLRADLSHSQAADELWALTSFDLYRRLVIERGWPAEAYEAWLARTLVQQLFPPCPGLQVGAEGVEWPGGPLRTLRSISIFFLLILEQMFYIMEAHKKNSVCRGGHVSLAKQR